jgi:hypothetical protein
MSKKKSFAIGCFNFGVKKIPPYDFVGSDYLEQLEKTLSKVTNLTNLNFESDEDFPNRKKKITKKTPHIQNDRGYFPEALILEIEFNLHIPYKIQAKIIGGKKKYLRTNTEDFYVKILNGYFVPVTVIECIEPDKKNDPSSAVQIVREYLKKELKEIASDYIRFEFLGPSPFHLDCYLKPRKFAENSDWFFETEMVLQKGYDDLTIYYDEDEFEDIEEAMYNLYPIINDELGFYYSAQQNRVHKMRSWNSLQKKLKKLLEIQKTKGLAGLYKKFFARPKLIEKIFVALATFEWDNIYVNNYKQNYYKQTFEVDDRILFKTFIDKELDEKDDHPIQQVSDLLNFFESRRVKSVELTMTIIAAIVGGAIGSIITIYLQ